MECGHALATETSSDHVDLCPSCGAAQRRGAVFCGRCGYGLKQAPPKEVPDAEVEVGPRCPECGRSVEEGWRACPYCGARLILTCPECGKRAKDHWKVCPYCEIQLPFD